MAARGTGESLACVIIETVALILIGFNGNRNENSLYRQKLIFNVERMLREHCLLDFVDLIGNQADLMIN